MSINTNHALNEIDGAILYNNNQNFAANNVTGVDIDCSLGNFFYKDVNGNVTFTNSNVPAAELYSFTLQINYTSGSVTFFVDTWVDGTAAPTLAPGESYIIPHWTYDGGTTWYGRGA